MVYVLPGVEVSSNKPATVKILHRGDERRHTFHWVLTVTFQVIFSFHGFHNTPCLILQVFLHQDCFQLDRGRLQILTEIENDASAKMLGVNKVYYAYVNKANEEQTNMPS